MKISCILSDIFEIMLSFSPFGVYTLTFIENNNLGYIVVWFLSQDVSNF